MPAPASSAFISYSREDSAFALRLAKDLKAAGASVWLDQLEIKLGGSWDNAIEEALTAAPRMLIVLSPSSARSDNVRDEISYALQEGKTIIPVLYMDCVVPLRLQRKQRVDFRADYAQGLAELLTSLGVNPPDDTFLKQAAEREAQTQAVQQAREAETRRIKEIAEQQRREEADTRSREAEQQRLKESQKPRPTPPPSNPTPKSEAQPQPALIASIKPIIVWAILIFATAVQLLPLLIRNFGSFGSTNESIAICIATATAAACLLFFASRKPLWQAAIAVVALAAAHTYNIPFYLGSLPIGPEWMWIVAVCLLGIGLLRKITKTRIAIAAGIASTSFSLLQNVMLRNYYSENTGDGSVPFYATEHQWTNFVVTLFLAALFTALFFGLPTFLARRAEKSTR